MHQPHAHHTAVLAVHVRKPPGRREAQAGDLQLGCVLNLTDGALHAGRLVVPSRGDKASDPSLFL